MLINKEEALNTLLSAKNVIITAHVNPDGDALGSSLALRELMLLAGKKARVVIDDEIPKRFAVLPTIGEVIRPAGEKFDCDLLVVLDASLDRIGTVRELASAPVLNIDHHPTNDGQADQLWLDGERAATAELVFELFKLAGQEFTFPAAMALYTGLATDTGFFRYSNTAPRTLRMAAELIEAGVKPEIISEAMEMRPLAVVESLAKAMSHIEVWHEGRAAGIFLSYEAMQALEETEGLIDAVRVIEGVEIAAVLKFKEEKLARVSLRSKGRDVSKVALKFGGGGHKRAAGCGIEKPFDEAKRLLMEAIDEALEKEYEA